ncbi:hypothetical protein Tco_0890645 [Tanacetum coccineum]|uniref:Uncharacterized protein n=1 Tax=Tanacetum coccineum TaxID=301880 RepID=A0ABQ5C288_9ASTR
MSSPYLFMNKVGSIEPLQKPLDTKNFESSSYHALGACLSLAIGNRVYLIGIADDIASKFQNISIKSVLSKIVFGAAVYFVWQERTKDNSQRKKGLENLVEVIINTVRLRLSSISTIKTNVELVEKEWDVKCRSVQKFNGWIRFVLILLVGLERAIRVKIASIMLVHKVGKYVRSGCTTALNVVPWETDGESCLSSASTLFVANHAEKPEKFNGQNFKRWQQKMFFHLGTLNLAWFLNETAPQLRMERLNLGNSPTANIKGKGDVIHIWKRV